MPRADSLEKTLMLGGIGGRRRGRPRMRWLDGITDDGRESEWTPGVGDGQGGLACGDSWGHKESDTTERLNGTVLSWNGCWENSASSPTTSPDHCAWSIAAAQYIVVTIITGRINYLRWSISHLGLFLLNCKPSWVALRQGRDQRKDGLTRFTI